MSISSSLVLLLFLSLHACNARTLGIVHNDSAMDSHHSITKENDEKLNRPDGVSVQIDRKKLVADTPGTQNENRVQEKNTNGKKNDPGFRKNRKKQESGFTLDYLPPRTHPPVHN